ncbi:hypothetical protein MuYL_4384 [Mucilaginibacter xinganensis]|uniref:Uncharacterized protein n=1 Tax=Mucilaginibacter xinganensis TaxID=1234841 RepID=A0A223P291_9SPHI|nr:hypothetical protein MuYL_4384 [Mucilaginibacter xinganensis]
MTLLLMYIKTSWANIARLAFPQIIHHPPLMVITAIGYANIDKSTYDYYSIC